MADETIIMIERKGRTQFTKFIKLFKDRIEVPIKEVRSMMPKSTFYDFILAKIYALNESIKNIHPEIEPFIAPTLKNNNGKIVQTFKRSCDIEIIDEDPNFFYLRIKCRDGDNNQT